MLYMRKIKFNTKELSDIRKQFGDYLWAAVDTHRGVITAGDEYLSDLRDFLLVKRSKPENIFCVGIDLNTGEIYYPVLINRHNPYVDKDGIPAIFRDRIETLMRYFFADIPAYESEKKHLHSPKDTVSFSIR